MFNFIIIIFGIFIVTSIILGIRFKWFDVYTGSKGEGINRMFRRIMNGK